MHTFVLRDSLVREEPWIVRSMMDAWQEAIDKTYKYDGLSVFIDQASLLYLDGVEVDYVESLEGAGFKFNNPNVKSTCGCGSSFSV